MPCKQVAGFLMGLYTLCTPCPHRAVFKVQHHSQTAAVHTPDRTSPAAGGCSRGRECRQAGSKASLASHTVWLSSEMDAAGPGVPPEPLLRLASLTF